MNKLKEVRLRCRKTQQEVADFLSVDRTTVAKWEKERHCPDNATLLKLADFFNVSVDYLLGRDVGQEIVQSVLEKGVQVMPPPRVVEIGKDKTAIDLSNIDENNNTAERAYYFDPETAALAQELKDNPDYRVLLDATKNLKPESIKEITAFIKYQKAKEQGDID